MILGRHRIEFSMLAACSPTVAGLATRRLAEGDWRCCRIYSSFRRTFGASLLGIALVLADLIVLPALAVADAARLNWAVFASTGVYNYSTLLGGPLFEEPGWRGFALPRLESRFGPLRASLLLGLIWATWHVPFFWYPGWSDCPLPTYFVLLAGFSVLLAFATNLARFAVIPAILMHAAWNTSGRYFGGLFAHADPGSGGFLKSRLMEHFLEAFHRNLSISIYTLTAAGVWMAALAVILASRTRLGWKPEAADRTQAIGA
jgi:membrane protease YdiL (CAAX protease family)